MNRDKMYSDEFLNAFVDNQLDPEEKNLAYAHINQDENLNRRVCELRNIRDLVQLAYLEVPVQQATSPTGSPGSRRGLQVAAGFLLALAAGLGWLLSQPATTQSGTADGARIAAVTPVAGVKVLLHLNSGDPERMKEALNEAEDLLKFYKKTNQEARVEIITNGQGLNLLRADKSPYPEKIKRLYREYSNLVFIACQNSIDRLKQEQGIIAQLLPEAVVIDSAIAQIMRRQQQGWAYIQV